MRILLLSQWYDPEPADKIGGLARGLVALGHTVTVLTGFPNYPSGRLYPGYRLRWRQWESCEGVRVLRLPLYPSHDRSALRRAANYASFALSASVLGPVLAGPADVLWVYHPPLTVGVPAMWLAALRRMPFIYEVQDMWPETLAATGMLNSAWVSGLIGGLARFIYRRAAAITVISPGFKGNLVAKGLPVEKIHVIPNGADEAVYRPVPPDEGLACQHGLAGRFNVIFAGNMGAAQALEHVLAAAEQLGDLPAVQFVFIGDGVEEAALRQGAADRGLTNVRFIGRQPAEQMPHFLALADAVLMHLKRHPLFAITIPSKLAAYLACGRPIVCAMEGDTADLVRGAGAGLVCPPEDPQALADAVRALHAMPAAQRAALGEAGRKEFMEHFATSQIIGRYETLFRSVAQR